MNGKVHSVHNTEQLFIAVRMANEADIITVEPGDYNIFNLKVSKSLIIRASDPNNKPVFLAIGSKSMFQLSARCLIIQNIVTNATDAPCFHLTGGNTIIYSCQMCMYFDTQLILP